MSREPSPWPQLTLQLLPAPTSPQLRVPRARLDNTPLPTSWRVGFPAASPLRVLFPYLFLFIPSLPTSDQFLGAFPLQNLPQFWECRN